MADTTQARAIAALDGVRAGKAQAGRVPHDRGNAAATDALNRVQAGKMAAARQTPADVRATVTGSRVDPLARD